MDVKSVKSKLTEAGFEVVAIYSPVKRGVTIIFTDVTSKREGAKPGSIKRSEAALDYNSRKLKNYSIKSQLLYRCKLSTFKHEKSYDNSDSA